jgi:predicted ABC-type ATPase
VARVERPSLIVLAGPNGAGKSTLAPDLLQGTLSVREFVNADVIARGLSAFAPERVAMAAGRTMFRRLRELATQRVSFAFETTLASRSSAPWIRGLIRTGYEFQLLFLWLPSPAFAVQRVNDRVRMGGHGVQIEVIRRRYRAGLNNFFRLYRPLATTWYLYDNSRGPSVELIASGVGSETTVVRDQALWVRIRRGVGHGA